MKGGRRPYWNESPRGVMCYHVEVYPNGNEVWYLGGWDIYKVVYNTGDTVYFDYDRAARAELVVKVVTSDGKEWV